jgi:hypothetical protein
MTANANFDSLLSTTLANYRSQLTDNVFTARPLTYFLMEKGRIRMLNGGTKIIEPLIYGTNSTVGSYSGYDSLSLTPQEGISAAEYEWKQYAASISISGIEEAKNNGEQEIINLLEAKIMQAEESMRESFNQMFFADGTGNGGKDWNGLGNLVEASGTVGGINRATSGNEFWRSYEENTAGALTLAQMATAYNTVSVGNDHPDMILTTQTLFEKYEALAHPTTALHRHQDCRCWFPEPVVQGCPNCVRCSLPSRNDVRFEQQVSDACWSLRQVVCPNFVCAT